MKRVFAAILVTALVAAMPATASAAGSTNRSGGLLIPGKLPPFPGKGRQGSSLSSTSNRRRRGALPPVAGRGGPLPPVAAK